MRLITLPKIGTVAAWRGHARALVHHAVAPEHVIWRMEEDDGADDLFASPSLALQGGPAMRLPRAAVAGLEMALHHSDPERFARAHDVVSRMVQGRLRWGNRSDPAMDQILRQEKAVRRDIHKMHAFVRFRELGPTPGGRRAFAAWFEPDHNSLEAAAPFFARRFGDMDWVIATPTLSARFEDGALRFTLTHDAVRPPEDATEALWCTYFANIFNPARLMVSAMTSEMPRKYWKNLPEAALIPEMIRAAPIRARAMQDAAPTLPKAHIDRLRPQRTALPEIGDLTLDTLKPALDACRRCPIGSCATQGVAGEGPQDAALMIVGEQPGDMEDLVGRPFIGPAGTVFDESAARAGLDRRRAYVTNAVKHFKFSLRGKRRLHQRPTLGEIEHCRWWLDLERRLIRPRVILALGATAALALTGNGLRIAERRGRVEAAHDGSRIVIAQHPAVVLRVADRQASIAARQMLVEDIGLAMEELADRGPGGR